MSTYTKRDLIEHLAALGLGEGANVAVHSRLLSFGRIEDGPTGVYEALRSVVGATGTVAVPAYTLTLSPEAIFDPMATPSLNVGAFSEFVRRLPESLRSGCPLHSHAAAGPRAGILRDSNPAVSMGPGSDFDVLQKNGFKLLLLGCSFHEGATFIHNVEAMAGVPYRSWLELKRQVAAADGSSASISVRYYGRDGGDLRSNHLHRVEAAMRNRGLARCVAVKPGGRDSYLMSLTDLDRCVRDMLGVDPLALLDGHQDHVA